MNHIRKMKMAKMNKTTLNKYIKKPSRINSINDFKPILLRAPKE